MKLGIPILLYFHYVWKDTIWSFYTLQIGEVLLKRAVYEIEHGMRAEEDFPKDKNLEQKCSGKGGIMIELGSKALFFINLIIQAVAKCGGREGGTSPTASARLFIRLPKSRTRAFTRSMLRQNSLEPSGEV
jgi:hypothetical protein